MEMVIFNRWPYVTIFSGFFGGMHNRNCIVVNRGQVESIPILVAHLI